MAGEWRESTWGEEISLEYGKALRNYDKASGKFRVFGSNGPIGWTSQPLASGPGVILGRKGAYRGIEFSRDAFFVIDTAYYVAPKSELDMRWLYYAIKYHKLGEIDDGSPIPSTTRSAVYVRDMQVPPLAEQKAIAAVLGALDDKIELNQRMNATLEAMARALFQSWFVDFDPVRAKLDGSQPTGLDAATAALFPATFQDSPIGYIPCGWAAVPLYGTAQWVNGAAFKSEDFCAAGDGLPVIKIAELKDGIGAQTKWCQRQADPNQIIDTGDPLYSWSGSPDTSLEAFLWSGGRGLLNQHIFKVIVPTATQKHFVYYLLQYLRPVLVETARNKQTTGLGHVTIADMKRLLVCVPSKEVLAAFDRSVAAIFDRAFANTLESRTLATLRDTLLAKLLSGDLSVASGLEKTEAIA
jgi:type I restriction enzyme S subunit